MDSFPKLCLASQSASRQELLKRAKIRFEVIVSDIKENKLPDEKPERMVIRLALEKARNVIPKSNADIVVAADSIVVYKNKIYGKPNTTNEAIDMLLKLQGQTHQFITGMAVFNRKNQEMSEIIVSTDVLFSSLRREQIERYISLFQPFRFAGAYEMNGISSWFVKEIKGSHSNVTGLPMTELKEIIYDLGYNWFDLIEI